MTKFLTLAHIEKICYEYAKTHLAYDEPIPEFSTRFPGVLEACIEAPKRGIGRKRFYLTLPEQGAVLFYEMVKHHPFLNGNKRIAMVSLMIFLLLNKKWIHIGQRRLYDIAILVANSDPKNREGMMKLLSDFLSKNIVKHS